MGQKINVYTRILLTRRRRDLGRIAARYKELFGHDIEEDIKVCAGFTV